MGSKRAQVERPSEDGGDLGDLALEAVSRDNRQDNAEQEGEREKGLKICRWAVQGVWLREKEGKGETQAVSVGLEGQGWQPRAWQDA